MLDKLSCDNPFLFLSAFKELAKSFLFGMVPVAILLIV